MDGFLCVFLMIFLENFSFSSLTQFVIILELPISYCICDNKGSPLLKVMERGIKSLISYSKLQGSKDLAERYRQRKQYMPLKSA